MTSLDLNRVSKQFLVDQTDRRTRLRQAILAKWFGVRPTLRDKKVRVAVQDVSLSLTQGQSYALIGRNGAGKSTLLKIVAGTLTPDEGTLKVEGNVGGLIELGSGLDTRKTGRQNAIERASLLGIPAEEISDAVAAIELFAELDEQFEDPVSTYSSGMRARLGFAIAVSLPFDIMICDEALAVGDARFAAKCLAKVNELKSGRIFLFVSHSMTMVQRFCEEAMVLDAGRVVFTGGATEAVAYFQNEILQLEPAPQAAAARVSQPEQTSHPAYLEPIVSADERLAGWDVQPVLSDESLEISWRFEFRDDIALDSVFRLGFPLFSADGTMLFSCTLEDLSEFVVGPRTIAGRLQIPAHGLHQGNYTLLVALFEGIGPVLRQVVGNLSVRSTGIPQFGAYTPAHVWSGPVAREE